MLQNIRDKTEGWVTRVIFGLVCVAFILWGAHSWLTSSGSTNNAPASVNGKDITTTELTHSYQRLLQERRMQLGANFVLDPQTEQRLQQLALQKLVISRALVQSAEDNGLRYTPNQVAHVISGISAFQQDGRFSTAKFTQVLDNMGFSADGFFSSIREAMLINQLRFGIIASSFSLPDEVTEAIQLMNQQRDIAFTVIPKTIAINQVVVTEDEIKKYYDTHQEQFTTPPIVTVQYVQLSLSDFAQRVAISDDELLKSYEANNEAQKKPFDQVKAALRNSLAEQKALQNFSDAVDKLTNLTYTNPQSLVPAATALHLPIENSPALLQQSATPGLFANETLKSAAFSSEVLSGNNSNLINLDDKHSVVLHLLSQKPKVVKPLSDVHDQIASILKTQKSDGKAVEIAQSMVANILSGSALMELAKRQDLQVEEHDHLTRFNSGKNALIFNEAFQLPRPAKQNSAGMFRLPSADLAVIQVLKVQAAENIGLHKIEQGVVADKIANAYAQLAYELYVNDVLSHTKISINKKS